MMSPDQQSSVSSTSSATQYFNLDDSISSEFSSAVNQTGLMFMPLEQIKGIVEHLGAHQQIDVSTYWLDNGSTQPATCLEIKLLFNIILGCIKFI